MITIALSGMSASARSWADRASLEAFAAVIADAIVAEMAHARRASL